MINPSPQPKARDTELDWMCCLDATRKDICSMIVQSTVKNLTSAAASHGQFGHLARNCYQRNDAGVAREVLPAPHLPMSPCKMNTVQVSAAKANMAIWPDHKYFTFRFILPTIILSFEHIWVTKCEFSLI